MSTKISLASFLAILTLGTMANAADFAVGKGAFTSGALVITISGKIEKGDYVRLLKFLKPDYSKSTPEEVFKNRLAFQKTVVLDSSGGDVSEAMKIANLIEKSYANTEVPKGGRCYSSCFLIWAGGARHLLGGEIGVHRITLAGNDTNIAKSEKVVVPASQSVESYLLRVGIPRRIVDKMNETSSSDLFKFDGQWLWHEDLLDAIQYRPSFIDVAQKRCGVDPTAEDVRALRTYDKTKSRSWIGCIEGVRYENMIGNDFLADEIGKQLP